MSVDQEILWRVLRLSQILDSALGTLDEDERWAREFANEIRDGKRLLQEILILHSGVDSLIRDEVLPL